MTDEYKDNPNSKISGSTMDNLGTESIVKLALHHNVTPTEICAAVTHYISALDWLERTHTNTPEPPPERLLDATDAHNFYFAVVTPDNEKHAIKLLLRTKASCDRALYVISIFEALDYWTVLRDHVAMTAASDNEKMELSKTGKRVMEQFTASRKAGLH